VEERLLSWLTRDERARGQRLLVAVSGGADSLCLLHGLVRAREALGETGPCLLAAHFNHRLRGEESRGDEEEVRRLCQLWEVPLHVGWSAVDTPPLPSGPHEDERSFETRARHERYDFLRRIAVDHDVDAVLLAHHRDDQAETILYRILRGTGMRGLPGIRPVRLFPGVPGKRPLLVRPLLTVSRSEILDHVAHHGLAPRQDSSNLSLVPARNRLRLDLLPRLEAGIHPGARAALVRLGERARGVDEALEAWTDSALPLLLVLPGSGGENPSPERREMHPTDLGLRAPELAALPEEIRYRIADRLLGAEDRPLLESEFARLDTVVRRRIRSDRVRGARICHGDELLVLQSLPPTAWGRVGLEPPESRPHPGGIPPIPVGIPGETTIPWARVSLETTLVEVRDPGGAASLVAGNPRGVELLDLDIARPPLYVRSRHLGDRFWPLGSTGARKLGHFFSRQRIPARRRDEVPLLVKDGRILAALGHRIGHEARVTEATRKVLRIEVLPDRASREPETT
jgi:tRNA(Ile)-lysidine synthase